MVGLIGLKRVYEKPVAGDGYRVLVDRLWPRGVSKKAGRIDLWMRDVAPSDSLRRWFGHEEARWPEFRRRYEKELSSLKGMLLELRSLEREHGKVTLVFGAKDGLRNNAVVVAGRLRRLG